MHGNADAGSRYLSLALLTRSAMNNLKCVAQGQPVEENLSTALQRLLDGLRAQPAGGVLAQLQAGAGGASSYEELSTLAALRAEFEAANIAATFSDVLQDTDPEIKGEGAKKLIRFLGTVESKALHYYSRSSQQPSY